MATSSPTMSAGRAALAVARENLPRTILAIVVGWVGLWLWSEWTTDSFDSVVYAALTLVIVGTGFHSAVRRRRGLLSSHWSTPLFVFGGMAAFLAVADAIEPRFTPLDLLVLPSGMAVIIAIADLVERRVERQTADGRENPDPRQPIGSVDDTAIPSGPRT